MCESVHLFYMNLNLVCICYSCSYFPKIEDKLFFKGVDICNSVVILSKSLILYNVMCNEFAFWVHLKIKLKFNVSLLLLVVN